MVYSIAYFDQDADVISPSFSKTAPYADIPSQSGPNWGGIDREFIQAGHNDRIRQNGTIYQIRFALANALNLNQFYFTIWRKNGSNYDRIATTENLFNKYAIYNGVNIIDLNPPIEGVQEGDFYGYRIKASGNALYVDKNINNHLTYYIDSGATLTTNFDWTNQTNESYVFVIEPYMEKPYMIFIGDSIISGTPVHRSLIMDTGSTNISTSIENQWSMKVNGRTYQNMGYGGQNTTSINNRFNSDVVNLKPEFVLIEGGVNDLSKVSTSEILTNWESMIQKTHNNNITPVIMLILPSNKNGSDDIVNKIDYLNEQLIILATNYTPSIVVDARCYVGVYRPSGPYGNCWDTNASYTPDNGLHFNQFGNERIAQAIKDSFRFVHGKPGLHNLINSDGTIIYSINLSGAINTSWRMASTSGIANVSYNPPYSGEIANFTLNSGIIDWFNISNLSNLSPNTVCYLLDSNKMTIESGNLINGTMNFNADLIPDNYKVICNGN